MATYKELQDLNNTNFSGNPVSSSQAISSLKLIDPNSQGISSRDSGKSNMSRDLAGDYVYENQNKSIASPFASDYFNTKMWGLDLGEVTSKHKDIYGGINPYSQAVDFENLRRNEQSNLSAGVNLFNQFVGKTAVNAIGGIIGGFYGLGGAVVNQDSSLLFDNSVNRKLDEATDWIEQNNSTFTSKAGRDNAPLGFFSYETVKDFTDAYSFIAGAVGSEIIIDSFSGGIGLAGLPGRIGRGLNIAERTTARLGKAVGLGNGVRSTGNFVTRSEDIARLISSVDPSDINAIQGIARQTGMAVEDLQRYRRSIDTFNNTIRKGRQIVTGTFWEAGLEARHTKDDLVNSQTEKLDDFIGQQSEEWKVNNPNYREEQLKTITEVGNTAGIWTFGLNTAVLGASNYIQFPTIFGSRELSRANRMSGQLSRRGIADYIKAGSKPAEIAKTVLRALKSPATEFTEETLQGSINIGSKSYYESMLGTRTSAGELVPAVSNLSDAILTGLKQTYGTKEGLHEGVIGALVGAIGLPMLKKNKRGKLRSVEMSGGIFESIRELQNENRNQREAINNLNLNEFDTLLSYNKDNAIISSIEAKKATVAELKEDKFEIDRLNDNKVFRHVRDRLDKGLEDYMKQDVQELQSLSLEEYKTRFNKDASFTETQKNKETSDFANKVDIYSDAYKKVYEGLQMDRINNNSASKKLFDTLAYAVANEKIYSQRQKELTDKLLSNKELDLNYQELMQLSQLSDKYQAYENNISDYIKLKQQNKVDEFTAKKDKIDARIKNIRSKVSPEHQNILDDILNDKADTANFLTKISSMKDILVSDTYQSLIAESDLIAESVGDLNIWIEEAKRLQSTEEQATKYNSNKSSRVREMRSKAPEIIEDIKSEIEKNSSKSLEILRGKKETATQNEIEEYISLKDRATNAIRNSNRNNNTSFLDNLSNSSEDLSEMLDELANITKHQVMALDIATNLYGISKSQNAYSKIVNAEYQENIYNLNNDARIATQALILQEDEDIIAENLANLTQSIKSLKEFQEEYSELLTEEGNKDLENQLEKAQSLEEQLTKYLDAQDTKADIAEKTKAEDKKQEDQKSINSVEVNDKLQEAEQRLLDAEAEGTINNNEFDNSKITLFSSKNLHTITPNSNTNANNIKEKIDNGTIKYNSGVIASYLNENEDTQGFKDYINSLGLADSYNRGKSKVENNINLLLEPLDILDSDVKVFITHAPVNVNIYDKEVDIIEGNQELEIDENDTIVHNFLYFAPQLDNIDNSKIENYNKKKELLEQAYNNKLEELNNLLIETNISSEKETISNKLDNLYNTLIENGNTDEDATRLALESLSEDERNVLRNKNNNTSIISTEEYNKRKALLDQTFERDNNNLQEIATIAENNINDKVLFNFRQQLLFNNYNGLNELKMRLGNIINGYIEKVGDTNYEVEDFGITSSNSNNNFLITNNNEIQPEDILFGNQNGEYQDFTGSNQPVKLNRGSNINKTNAINSRIYLRYRTINNQEIPVLLNTSRLSNSPIVFDEIVHQIEQYFNEGKNPNNSIILKNETLSFLRNMKFQDFFKAFMDESNSGTSYAGLTTFNINTQDKNIHLGNLDLVIDSIETFNDNKANITDALSNMRFYMNKNSFRKSDGSFNREFLDFTLDNKLLSHTFNTNENIDKIFKPTNMAGETFNKAIQFHILNSESNKSLRLGKPKIKELTKSLNELLGSKDNKNLNWNNVFYNINGDVIKEAQALFKLNGNLTDSILQAFDKVFKTKIDNVKEYIKLYPNQYTSGLEETLINNDNIKILSSDKIIDKYIKIVYIYNNKFKNRDKTIIALSEFLQNKNYAPEYKNILLDKKIPFIKMMVSNPIEIEEEIDGKITSKTKYNFSFPETLTNNSPEENRERFNNIINAFGELDKTTRKFVPLIFNNNDKETSASKVFLDFSKSFVSNDGKQNELVAYHSISQTGIVSKGPGASIANGKHFNLAQFSYKDKKTGEIKYNNAVEFKYRSSNGSLQITNTPQTDFEFDSNGELTNGVIYITYINAKGFAEQQPVLIGKENNLNLNNYIKTIKIPGLNNDFTIHQSSADNLNALYNRFDTAIDNLNRETSGVFKDNKALKEEINIPNNGITSNVETNEDEETIEEMKNRLLNSAPTIQLNQPANREITTEVMGDDFIAGSMSNDLASMAMGDQSFTEPTFDSEPELDFDENNMQFSDFILGTETEESTTDILNNTLNNLSNEFIIREAPSNDKEALYNEKIALTERNEELKNINTDEAFNEIKLNQSRIRKINPLIMGYNPNTNLNIPSLNYEQEDKIELNKDILKNRLNRALNKQEELTQEILLSRFSSNNITNYKNFIEMLNIIYRDNSTELNKMINFANKIFNKTKNDSDDIISNCN